MFTRPVRPADTTRTSLWRSRWAAIGAAIAVSLGAGGLFVAQAAPGPAESTIVAVTPERILDTRDPTNLGLPGPFVSQVSQKLQVTGSIPTATGTKVVVPAGATGVLLNVTSVGSTANGFISVRPGDATGTATTSSVNVNAGVVVPNSVQVAMPTAGTNAGKIDITWDAYGQTGPTTDILIDVVGYTTNVGLQQLVADVAAKANVPRVTRLDYSGATPVVTDGSFQKVRDVGVFTKAAADTGVQLTWQSPVFKSLPSPASCVWQVRVDGVNGSGTTSLSGADAVVYMEQQAVTWVDYFSGLAAGPHTVSIWVRGTGGTTCGDNSGNFPRSVFVEEMSMISTP